MSSVLVTGGAGFIGSHTCISLLEKGFYVYAIDSFKNSDVKIFHKINNYLRTNKFKYFKVDTREKEKIKNVFQKALADNCPINSVIHLAGLKSVNESVKSPIEYWDVNVLGTINLLKTMQLLSVLILYLVVQLQFMEIITKVQYKRILRKILFLHMAELNLLLKKY